jgi:hypothetical protein
MQTGNADTPQTFPRLATYLEYDEPIPFAPRVPETPVVVETASTEPRDCDATQPTSFNAILDAYARDPDRWDGLE